MSGVNQLPSIDKIFKEDDDDFTPTVGSNLAAIFGIQQKSQDNVRSSSPKHVSGKQSIGNQSQAQTSSSPKNDIIHTEAVHAFKLQNGQYLSIGKVGIALTGNVATKQYNIILYRGTQNYISVLPITPDFVYTVQDNNYASYAKGDLSILFENGESSAQFAREICICKYFSRPVRSTGIIMYQDLNSVSKDATAKEGDGISLKYTTSLDMSQPLKIDNNLKQTMTLEISKDDNWERSLVGTSMGLRRLIIVPSNKQIGLGPGFPKDRDIIMEIEVVSLFTRDELSPPIVKPPEISQKATIISRMAKMGQSILPKLPPSTTTDSDDTEEEVVHKTTRHKRAESSDTSSIKKHSHSNVPSDTQMQKKVLNRGDLISSTLPIAQRSVISTPAYAPQWAPSQIQQQYVSIDGRLLPLQQQQAIAQPIPASMDPSLNVFLSETRTQNTELRMGLSKISDNVQKLLDKFHVLELQQASTPVADKSLEATLKALMDMNRSTQDVESRNCETKSTFTTEQVSMDRNVVEINNQLSLRLIDLEKKLESANEKLTTKSASIKELNHQSDSLKQINSELKTRIEELEKELSESQSSFTELSKKLEQSIENENKCREENTLLENRVAELISKCKGMEETIWKSETSDWVDKSKELKEIMAEVFQELCDSFSEGNYPSDYIKSIIQRTIRSITLRIVSEEKEKKREKLNKITDKSDTSILKTETNEAFKENNKQNSDSIESNKVCEELAVSTMPEDIIDSPNIRTDSVSGSQKKPPPVPKFDLESGYDPPI